VIIDGANFRGCFVVVKSGTGVLDFKIVNIRWSLVSNVIMVSVAGE
jgi:hypothetical protein